MSFSIQNFFFFFWFAMRFSVQSLAVLGQSGHIFKAAVARDGGHTPFLVLVVCFQERGEVLLSPRLLSLGKMSVKLTAFLLFFDAEDVNS